MTDLAHAMLCLGTILIAVISYAIGTHVERNRNIFAMKCKNCKNAVVRQSRDSVYRVFCLREIEIFKDGSSRPVDENDWCGHFELTDQLALKQVQDGLEKGLSAKKCH